MHRIDLARAKGVMDMRAAMDGLAARYAALRVAQGVTAESFLTVFDAMQTAAQAGDYERFLTTDLAFHLALVELAGIDGLLHVYKHLRKYQIAFHKDTIREYWPDLNVLFEGHREIAEAILAGDPNAAEDCAKAHLDAIWYRLAEHSGTVMVSGGPLDRACAYIAFHYDGPIQLGMLARKVAQISPGHLTRLFKVHKGTTFIDYLRDIRLQKAAETLRNTKMPIKRVAGSVGYSDSSRFAVHFRRRFGMPPLLYRTTHVR